MNIQEIRKKYPSYNDLSDTELAQKLHAKFYSDIPFQEFSAKIGLQSSPRDLSNLGNVTLPSGETVDTSLPEIPGISPPNYNAAVEQSMAQANTQQPQNLHETLFGKPGQQLLPGAEVLKFASENPDVVGATLASLAVGNPELAAPMVASRFPALTQLASQAVTKIPAAFLGGSAGHEVGRQTGVIESDPNAELSDLLLNNIAAGAKMATAEAAGAVGLPVISKLLSPGASAMTKESGQLLKFAQQQKVPVSPTEFAPNLTNKVMQGGTDTFLPSRLMNDASRRKAVIRFNEMMTEIPEQVGTIQGNKIVTEDTIEALKNLYSKKELAGKNLASNFLDKIGPTTEIPVTGTKSILESIDRSAVDPSLREFAATKLKQFGENSVTAQDLETALRQIGSIKPKGDSKFLEQLRSAMKKDFSDAGAPTDMLNEANQAFKENIGLLASQGARQLKAMLGKGEEPSFLTAKIFKSGNEGLIKSLSTEVDKGALSKETWDSLRAQNLQNMIQNASTESQKLMGLRIIDGAKLEKILESNKAALDLAYKDNPAVLTAMRNLSRLAKASRQDLSNFETGMSETLKAGNVAAMAGAFYANPLGLLLGSGGSAMLAKSMMNPNAKIFKWLTTGVDSSVAKNISENIKLGGRLAFSNVKD